MFGRAELRRPGADLLPFEVEEWRKEKDEVFDPDHLPESLVE